MEPLLCVHLDELRQEMLDRVGEAMNSRERDARSGRCGRPAVLRLGYGAPGHPTPRRDVAQAMVAG